MSQQSTGCAACRRQCSHLKKLTNSLVCSQTGRVLRVRKVRDKDAAIPRDAATDALEALVWQDAFDFSSDTVKRQVNYEQQHLRRYLNGYVPRGQLVPIPPSVLEELAERGKGCDPHAPALLLPDHTQLPEPLPPGYTKVGPCVCVEIKPKSGHVSSSPYISRENDIKRHVPRYQMHMLMKHMKVGTRCRCRRCCWCPPAASCTAGL